jgi:hypothetical protein
MLPVAEIVPSLRTTRADFAELFLRAQAGLQNSDRKPFDVVTDAHDDAAAFEASLTYAEGRGFLKDFVDLVVTAGLETGRLARALLEEAAPSDGVAELQAMANDAAGFFNPETWQRGFANGTRWTARVLIDGSFRGTGVLVSPNIVLTAWHVLMPLFDLNAGKWQPRRGAPTAARLSFEFDDYLTLIGRSGQLAGAPVLRAQAHQEWCFTFSACHADELQDRLPANLNQLDKHWDYALLRLTPPPGLERPWVPLSPTAVVPRKGERAVVFQHPGGNRLKADAGSIVDMQPPTPAIPRFRFLHDSNALHGSSGGPCFDKEFELFGFHQGEWKSGTATPLVINRGVPIVRVLEHVGPLPGLDPSEAPVWHRGKASNFAPIIGTEGFQKIVWQSVSGRKPRVILIEGDKGGGKSFCLDVLSAMLAECGHLKLMLTAGILGKQDPTGIAATICSAGSATLDPITPQASYSSTVSVWLRDHVARNIVQALDKVRDRRTVWICIRELNHFGIESEDASDLMHILYEETRNTDWLRFVLDGMQAELPVTVQDLVESCDVSAPTLDDLKTLMRRYNAKFQLQMTDKVIDMLTKPAFNTYRRDRRADPAAALKALAEEIAGRVAIAALEQTEG